MDIARLFRNSGLQNSPHGNFRIGRPQYFHNFSLPQEKPATGFPPQAFLFTPA
jgi:hypothetical protein